MNLTDVGQKVFLDRYSQKDNRNLVMGSVVIACIDKVTHARELGKIAEITDDYVLVEFPAAQFTLKYRFPDRDVKTEFTVNDFDVPVETVDDVFERIAKAIHPKILPYLKEGKFIPGGRILAGAGTNYPLSMFNCSVLPAPQDSRAGIFKTAADLAEVLSKGSGVGIPVMSLRPKFSAVYGVGGRSSGSVSWMDLYSQITDKIEQGGCILGESLIATSNGDFPIKNLVGSKPWIYTYDFEARGPVLAQAKWVGKTGTKPVYKLTLANGFVLYATDDHLILLLDGTYTAVKDLKPDQEIMSFRSIPSTVVSVEYSHTEDVYDMEIPETNNFAVVQPTPHSTGIFIHNSRRGALILVQYIWHPDIIDFINCKKQKNFAIHANLSVALTSSFMKAVEKDENWDLLFPDTKDPKYDTWDGDLEKWLDAGGALVTYQTIKARALWDMLVESAWSSGEPGVFFVDRYNQESNSAYYNKIQCTNPCVTGDTLIAVADGRKFVSIKELADAGKDIYVWCVDLRSPTGNSPLRIRLGRNPRKTGEQREVYTVTLKDGTFVRATKDHKFIRKDGTDVLVADLKENDALFPFMYNVAVDEIVVDKVEFYGLEDVYNLTVDDFHNYIVITDKTRGRGVTIRNCGEIGISAYSLCLLGHINLSAFKFDVLDDISIRKELAPLVHDVVEFLDNVIDVSQYPLSEQEVAERGERRVGLGSLGLAEFLMNHEIRYGSKQSLDIADMLYRIIAEEAYKKSIDLAKKKGAFPQYKDIYLTRPFAKKIIERLPPEYQAKAKKFGIRNVTLLTQAPTGTVSLILDTSSGIEPYFSLTTKMNTKLGTIILYARPVREYMKKNKLEKIETPPDWMVGALDLKPIEHVTMQATIQKWVDSSISKTINLPSTATVKDVDEAYRELYKQGCKGGTVYRKGSRDDILVSLDKDPSEKKPSPDAFKTRSWEVRPAPKAGTVCPSDTVSQIAPAGEIFMTLRKHPDFGLDVADSFLTASKAGTEVMAVVEGFGRLISLILRINSPVSQYKRLFLIAKSLLNLGGKDSVGFGPAKVLSTPDGIAKCIVAYLKKVEYKGEPETTVEFDICPSCHSPTLKMESGCSSCSACGYSKC